MCRLCNYTNLIKEKGIEPISNRVRVLELIGSNPTPMAAQDILTAFRRSEEINRVTIYRILDLLVEKGLVQRLSSGGRGLIYGLSPNENHPPHPHFRCKSCGVLQCMQPDTITLNILEIQRSFAGEISNVEIRIDGTCGNCLKAAKKRKKVPTPAAS